MKHSCLINIGKGDNTGINYYKEVLVLLNIFSVLSTGYDSFLVLLLCN